MNTTERTLSQPSATDIVNRLLRSPSVCDQRKALDLQNLLALGAGRWKGRFAVVQFAGMADQALGVVCSLKVPGLVWSGGAPAPWDTWLFVLVIPHNYPLSPPSVQFLDRTLPWCSHVVHRDFLPEAPADLPPEFQALIREGSGHTCLLRRGDWSPAAASHNCAVVVWLLSRVISLNKTHAEAASLNKAARDYTLRLEREGRLPLGEPLPYPDPGAGPGEGWVEARADGGPATGGDIEWSDEPDAKEDADAPA